VEQEIAMLSDVFLESEGSSWSGQVSRERYVRDNYANDKSNKMFFGKDILEGQNSEKLDRGGPSDDRYVEQDNKSI